jgi:hypothetical protein
MSTRNHENERDDARGSALARIVELARAHALTPAEIQRALAESGDPAVDVSEGRDAGAPDWVRSLLALVGGLLVLAGLVGLLQLIWDDLSSLARVLSVFGSGVVLLVLGLVASRDQAFDRAASPLLLVAGLFQTVGLFVLLHEYSIDVEDEMAFMLVFGAIAGQFAALFAALKRADLLFLLLVAATLFLAATLAWLGIDGEWIALALGAAGLLVSFGLERTRWTGVCSLSWVAYAFMLAVGLFELVEGAFPLDLALIVTAALLIQLSVYVARRGLLTVAVIIMLVYLGYYTNEYFADVLGWPIALIAFGLVLLALSGYAVRLGRSMARPAGER